MELVQKHRAAVLAKTAGTEANVEAQLAHYAQTEALTLARIELETNVAKAHARGQVTVQLESELKELRAKEAHWEAERGHERGKMELRVDEADAKSKRAMDLFAEVQDRKAERISNQQNFQNQRMEQQNELQTKMMEMAANNGALTPEVMQEFLKQQTAQKAVDATDGQPSTGSPKICSCGTGLSPGWKACPNCGSPIA
jgi:hypothetical protein